MKPRTKEAHIKMAVNGALMLAWKTTEPMNRHRVAQKEHLVGCMIDLLSPFDNE